MKQLFTLLALAAIPAAVSAQSVPAAITVSQHDLRGTARFMSMAGAFGALGGDLSCLSQNPGGIGIYRSNDIGFTLGLDFKNSTSDSQGFSTGLSNTSFNLNNIGGVFTMKLYNNSVPNINFGFTYNKVADFNRRFKGTVPQLRTSLSNYIAGVSNQYGLNEWDVSYGDNYDPYNPPVGNRSVPWITILGYYGFLTTPEGDPENPQWYGQFGDDTKGTGYFDVEEKGSVDEYNIAVGGNIANTVFWGADLGITSLDYRISTIWEEDLHDAYVFDPNTEKVGQMSANWAMFDNYRLNGTGVNFKLGVIVKPIQELRIGFAFHTPTYYTLNETYFDEHLDYSYPFPTKNHSTWANDGQSAVNSLSLTTPWRLIASLAGVIGQNLIISADYEWATYGSIKYGDASNYGYYDPWWDWDNPWNDWGWDGWYGKPAKNNVSRSGGYDSRYSYTSPNDYANAKIKEIYRDTHTLRLGAEFRVLPNFSIRAGYSFSTSPVSDAARNNRVSVPGTGILTNYSLDNTTNIVSCGVGYRYKGFYADLAYMYKNMSSDYYPFSVDIADPSTAPKSKVTFENNNLALTMGYKF